MALRLTEKPHLSLEELEGIWKLRPAELRYLLEQGRVNALVFLPLMSVYENGEGGRKTLCHWEGFIRLTRHQCQRLFRRNSIGLRMFHCERGERLYVLPDTADDFRVRPGDLLIDRAEWQQLATQGQDNPPKALETSSAFPSFKEVHLKGETYRFGDIQAACLRLLHEAASTGQPWMNGKRLLQEAGSRSFSLSNVFKHKPVWRELVESDGRGNYRMASHIVS